MGWLFLYDATRKDVIADCIRGWTAPACSSRSIAHCTRGNVLWVVWEQYVQVTGHFNRVILCILLQNSADGWGYKDLDEGCHPYYYTCPLKYLNMGTRVLCKEWREGVREYHANRKARIRAKHKKRLAS